MSDSKHGSLPSHELTDEQKKEIERLLNSVQDDLDAAILDPESIELSYEKENDVEPIYTRHRATGHDICGTKEHLKFANADAEWVIERRTGSFRNF